MDAQIRLGCLELAAQLAKPQNIYDAQGVVNIASVLYNFCQASPLDSHPVENADKPKRRKSISEQDILT